MTSDSQTRYITGFVRPFSRGVQPLLEFAQAYCEYAFVISHDFDKHEDGAFVPSHVHFVFKLRKRMRLTTFRNRLADFLNVEEISITASVTIDENASVQYLIHKNQPEKYQYKVDDIASFGAPKAFLESLLAGEGDISFDRLVELCTECNCISEVIHYIGIRTYTRYRWTIRDIWNDVHNDKED